MPEYCIIQESVHEQVRGFGKAVKGVYYLVNENLDLILKYLSEYVKQWRNENETTKVAASSELLIPTSVGRSTK